MKSKLIIYSLLLVLNFATVAIAQTADKGVKSGARYVKLLHAYSQGAQSSAAVGQAANKYSIIMVWKGAEAPSTLFWRGDAGWWPCKIAKAHKAAKKNITKYNVPFVTSPLSPGDIIKGDTLAITAMPGGKFPIPTEIPKKATNTLFFKADGSGWLSVHVKKVTKLEEETAQ
jgi:hypothetical protein